MRDIRDPNPNPNPYSHHHYFFKVHGMSYAARISNSNLRNIFYGSFFLSPKLVACFLGNKSRNIFKRTLVSPLLKHRRKGGEEKQQIHRQLQTFLRSFSVTRKHNEAKCKERKTKLTSLKRRTAIP